VSKQATRNDGRLPALLPGDHVTDCDGDEQRLLVVAVSATRADEYKLDDVTGSERTTGNRVVADVNIDYPGDDAVIECVYPQHGLQLSLNNCYAFPRSRLRLEHALGD
jgi:hypothetical protein